MRGKFIFISGIFFLLQLQSVFGQNTDTIYPVNGKYKTLYPSGIEKEKGYFRNSMRCGVWYYYAENGVVEKKVKYREDKIIWQIFYNKGKITKTIDRNGVVKERPKCGC